ncbi:MAG: rhomboid family intramembrane serine protease [Spirochaetaceae bacterium]|jgi:membrane associated rhomboid family serine protease|nr:rhomboid family intramembrane serine protease [Spirochaetaceae bacterium]
MRIKYNAPTVLTFTFTSALVLLLSQTILRSLTIRWFMVPGRGGFSPGDIRNWVTLFTHVIGHADWSHLASNFSLILLLGPILEESYGSRSLLFMIVITALVTGVLNVLLFSTSLLGASGVVFMMILLASFTNFNKGEIPLTFILVLIFYLGTQLINAFRTDNISEFAHIAGGLCGSLFGFLRPARRF